MTWNLNPRTCRDMRKASTPLAIFQKFCCVSRKRLNVLENYIGILESSHLICIDANTSRVNIRKVLKNKHDAYSFGHFFVSAMHKAQQFTKQFARQR